MREIEFRGKRRFDGKWFFGSLLTNLFETSDGSGNIENGMKGLLVYIQNRNGSQEVVPDTVGEYTGLEDRSGREIFEGDIVQSDSTDMAGDVYWLKEHASFYWGKGQTLIHNDELVIIGNIHDKAETMERIP